MSILLIAYLNINQLTSTKCQLGVMFKNKNGESNNISGKNIARIRKGSIPKLSQRAFADKLQLYGIDVDKNAIQRIECGKRFVTDIELVAIAEVLNVSVADLLKNQDSDKKL